METTMIEKRHHRRRLVQVAAWMCLKDESFLHGTTTLNLSADGAMFYLGSTVRPGDLVMVGLEIEPGGFPMELKGRVTWVRRLSDGGNAFGVRFIDMLEDEHDTLSCFLDGNMALLAAV